MDTQSTSDLHYAFKRCLSEYFYIHSLGKYLFFNIANVRECRYSEDGSVLSIDTDDSEEKLKKVLISRKVWKYFDAYCYSVITDNLPEAKNIKTAKTLKIKKIPSFRTWINKELNEATKKCIKNSLLAFVDVTCFAACYRLFVRVYCRFWYDNSTDCYGFC